MGERTPLQQRAVAEELHYHCEYAGQAMHMHRPQAVLMLHVAFLPLLSSTALQ